VSTKNETPDILVEPTPPIPTTHSSDTKGKTEKQQQSIITQRGQSENTEDEKLTDAESFSTNNAANSQELPKTTPHPSNNSRQNGENRP
jgi:hypothetical protein